MEKLTQVVYLLRLSNKDLGEESLQVCGSVYDTVDFSGEQGQCEYKDLSKEQLYKGWEMEKKEQIINWNK